MAKTSQLQRAIDRLDAEIAAKRTAFEADLQAMTATKGILFDLQRTKQSARKRKTADIGRAEIKP